MSLSVPGNSGRRLSIQAWRRRPGSSTNRWISPIVGTLRASSSSIVIIRGHVRERLEDDEDLAYSIRVQGQPAGNPALI